MAKNRSKVDKMPGLELVLKNAWKNNENLVFGYSKTVVSHWSGCIFQGFQSLQKVRKTSLEIDSKCPQNPLKSGLESSPRCSLKLQ